MTVKPLYPLATIGERLNPSAAATTKVHVHVSRNVL